MRWNYIQRRRIKICAMLLAIALLYLNINFLSNSPLMLTGRVTGSLDMCVDQQMSIAAIPTLNATENRAFTYDLNVTNEANYSTLFYGDNTTLFNINSTTGLIQFTPTSAQVASYWINITARNNFCNNNDTSIAFLLNVTPSNYAPTLSMANQALTEDVAYTYNVSQNASDLDGDTLKFYDNTALFVIGENSGIIAFTPTNDDVGVHIIRLYVVDTNSLLGYQDVTFTINNVNDAPVLSAIGAKTAYVNESWNTTFIATDVDAGEQLTFRSNYSIFLNNSGKISTVSSIVNYSLNFTTNWTANGTYSINITVNDTTGAEDSEVISFTILHRNLPPNITNYTPSDLTPSILQGATQDFTIDATDPDGTTPSARWYVDNAFTNTTYNFSYTPSSAGTFNITAVVTDGEINDSISWTLTVIAVTPTVPTVDTGGGAGGGIGGFCGELWVCTDWSPCPKNNVQLRECTDIKKCRSIRHRPNLTQECIFVEHPSCFDGVKNQDEILADCGGVCTECASCNDKIQNQGETGLDCGGPCPACKHQEVPKLLGKYRDRIMTPIEILTYPNESWMFWALTLIALFVAYKAFAVFSVRVKKKEHASKEDHSKEMEQIDRLIRVTEVSMKDKDYKTAKAAYDKINGIYRKLPDNLKGKAYSKIEKLQK